MSDSAVTLDTTLLRGFRYRCLPGCGLCCYAEPRVDPEERRALVHIAPEADLVDTGGATYLRAFPDGGACTLLRDVRCSAHGARPHPCREFPVHVHVGLRLQASLVLSCPGIELVGLRDLGSYERRALPVGFDSELASAEGRIGPATRARLRDAARRRGRLVRALEREGRWEEEDDVRDLLRARIPLPEPGDYPAEDPPAAEDGLELLPLFYDQREGPVALAAGLGGWEALELQPTGGVARHLGSVPPPAAPPPLDADAQRLLSGYLRYFLERDLLFASVVPRMSESSDGTLSEWIQEELARIGATVVSRSLVRAKLVGEGDGPLTSTHIAAGIRASDQDLLDVPTWGDRL